MALAVLYPRLRALLHTTQNPAGRGQRRFQHLPSSPSKILRSIKLPPKNHLVLCQRNNRHPAIAHAHVHINIHVKMIQDHEPLVIT
jgi:hypothetical protein